MALSNILNGFTTVLVVIGTISGGLVSLGIIYVWIKKPINIFFKYNNAVHLSQNNKERIDAIEPVLKKLAETMENHDVDEMRRAIIDFSVEVNNGEKKTEEQFAWVKDIARRYLLSHNGYVQSQIDIINRKYEQLQGLK